MRPRRATEKRGARDKDPKRRTLRQVTLHGPDKDTPWPARVATDPCRTQGDATSPTNRCTTRGDATGLRTEQENQTTSQRNHRTVAKNTA